MPTAADPDRKSEVKLRVRCRHCQRVQTRRGRAGIYWRCKYEDCRSKTHRGLNPGPALEAAVMAPVELQRQRRRRPAAPTDGGGAGEASGAPVRNAEGPDGHVEGVAPPAPVRRRTRRAPAAAAATPTSSSSGEPPQTVAQPDTSTEPQRTSWVDRWVLGTEET